MCDDISLVKNMTIDLSITILYQSMKIYHGFDQCQVLKVLLYSGHFPQNWIVMPDVILWICGLFEDFVKCQLLEVFPHVAVQVFMYNVQGLCSTDTWISVISQLVDQTGFLLGPMCW